MIEKYKQRHTELLESESETWIMISHLKEYYNGPSYRES